nr:reverse transcriptase domain-containing protein [Tanacetum cinerariifolium]
KHDAKPRLIRWVLLLKGVDIEIKDKKGAEKLAADHLSRLENPNLGAFTEEEITDEFPNEHLMILKAELNDDEPCTGLVSSHLARILSKLARQQLKQLPNIEKSSVNTFIKSSTMSWKIAVMQLWKVAGAIGIWKNPEKPSRRQ